MAAGGLLRDSSSEQFNHKQAYHREYKCANCFTLENRLNEALLEISSSQFIIKFLQKELNEVIAQRMAGISTSVVNEHYILASCCTVLFNWFCRLCCRLRAALL
jgi:hypothetical protein